MAVIFFRFSFILLSALLGGDFHHPEKEQPIHILFVGNSLTYANDLPALFKQEARENKIKVKVKTLAKPNYALEDHWLDGTLQLEIAKGKYDYIILQQGPSSRQDGKDMLLNYGKKIKELCELNDCKLAFFMVWPSRQYYSSFPGVISNYEFAAEQTDAIICPVGKEWKTHFDRTGDFSFLSEDGFHPSLKGSKSVAKIIFNYLGLSK
ncbi:SGNH/GDSL hydrolase family protein [Marivirga sp. S37H4]|uniref:SGNH/GDSL hydrolase family protein n=1 Tax=Marivirga aurantiaca TaxID=2802615 RepID=A0A934WYJ6_9BACT|nr:SGNH/GDSL hydrolase family protein [Marivirga aurantiaca]MBK6265237.1 SGNH/GDSL hydrolase family protein [Marivirga aurantiaca]